MRAPSVEISECAFKQDVRGASKSSTGPGYNLATILIPMSSLFVQCLAHLQLLFGKDIFHQIINRTRFASFAAHKIVIPYGIAPEAL